MKYPISWHRSCLANSQNWLAREERAFLKHEESLKADRESVAFYESQIAEAVRLHLDGFDPERFLKHKTKPKK